MAATGRAGPPARRHRARLALAALRDWRLTVARAGSLLRSGATSFVVLSATLWLLPGVNASGLVGILWLVVLVAAVGALLRPVLLALATVLGGLGALLLGACLQAVVMYLALWLDPAATVSHFGMAFLAAWVAAALSAAVNWVVDAGTDEGFLSETLRGMSRTGPAPGPRPPGLLVVQLDGVSAPLLRWAVKAGNLPHIGGWLRAGSHRLRSWHTGLPATTPAAQAGLLHGTARQVPAFRWYEKDTGRLVVANRPRDAAEVQARISTGRGLLAGGGASIGNVFSGDAPISLLTVSDAALPGRSARGYAAFMTSPYGFARAVVRGVGELVKELHQARRQRRRDVRPRVPRGGAYLLLRPVTNVLLRDLNVSLVAEQMARGAPVVFCDFVDYDEVAHHAGPARPEALAALEGLDRVVGMLERLNAVAAREYAIVVLSDHGQSQGATFRQRYGETLADAVRRLLRAPPHRDDRPGEPAAPAAAMSDVEGWGPVNVLLTGVANRPGPAGAATRAATRGYSREGEVALGPAEAEQRAVAHGDPELVVASSGNLALVYLTRAPGKLDLATIEAHYPGLVARLAAHPGIGVVVVGSAAHGPLAVGARGTHRLRDGVVQGEDPLAPYGPRAAGDLLRHQATAHVGDLVLISAVDPDTDEVPAFEELVGSHGGLGGWQTEAVLVHPVALPVDEAELIGPEAVHRQLVRWRDALVGPGDRATPETVSPADGARPSQPPVTPAPR
ncbi:MAG TPA: phage holin family protein [Pilimelia sp.]|nr:phage holin family protein [Pilimelia sp.]